MLADGRSAALVAIDGSVDWWCPDRFDGPSIFARLLDAAGGHWSLRPVDPFRVERRYLDGSLAIQSTVVTDRGAARLTDVLLLAGDASAHDVGRGSPACLARVVEGIEGHIDWTMDLVARPHYGRTTVEIRR